MIRKATENDIDIIMKIYDNARNFMIENGNPTQWEPGYPGEGLLRRDIINGDCYVCVDGENIIGVFTFIVGKDPTYNIIEHGKWHYDIPYGTIHRLASNGKTKGVAKYCFNFCVNKMDYVRVDTHKDNKPMQAAIEKFGFQKCGIIHVANGSERIAFDYHK